MRTISTEYTYTDYCPRCKKRTPHVRVFGEKKCRKCGHEERRI